MHPGPLHPQSTYSRQSVRYAYLKIQPQVLWYKCYILELLPYLFFISNLICFLLKNREYLIYYHQGRTFIRSFDYTIDSIKIHLLSTSTFVWWLKILSEPFTKSSKDNAMSIYSFLTHLSIIDFCLEFKLSPAFLRLCLNYK